MDFTQFMSETFLELREVVVSRSPYVEKRFVWVWWGLGGTGGVWFSFSWFNPLVPTNGNEWSKNFFSLFRYFMLQVLYETLVCLNPTVHVPMSYEIYRFLTVLPQLYKHKLQIPLTQFVFNEEFATGLEGDCVVGGDSEKFF